MNGPRQDPAPFNRPGSPDPHEVHVGKHRRGGRDLWSATCITCGYIGAPQAGKYDALAIAQRHAAVGGFDVYPPDGEAG
jgi:hypothetical protein